MDTPGSGDCEARLDGLGQPVLAATSLAYIVAGIVLVVWAHRRSDVHRGEVWLYAAGLVAAGVGSVDYHGPAIGPEPQLHDGGLALALLVAFGIDLRRLGLPTRGIVIGLVALAVALGAVIAVWPDVSPSLAGIAGIGLVAAEVLIYRRHLRRPSPPLWWGLAALAVGGVIFALSRTGGPLCTPESLLQGHGLWHLLTAVALTCWGVVSLPDPSQQTRALAPVLGSTP